MKPLLNGEKAKDLNKMDKPLSKMLLDYLGRTIERARRYFSRSSPFPGGLPQAEMAEDSRPIGGVEPEYMQATAPEAEVEPARIPGGRRLVVLAKEPGQSPARGLPFDVPASGVGTESLDEMAALSALGRVDGSSSD